MQELTEIEVKALVNEGDFYKLSNYFNLNENDFVKQVNYYFDTNDELIIKSKSSLRVREVNNKYILTFKLKKNDEVLELEQDITLEDFKMLKANQKSFNEYYYDLLKNMNINGEDIKYLGYLITYRASIPYKQGELFFDKNYYQDTNDYEIEYETHNYEYGIRVVNSLFNSLGIKFEINDLPKRYRAISKGI